MTTSSFVLACVPDGDNHLRTAAYRLALTGTPVVGKPAGLVSATDFVAESRSVILLTAYGVSGRPAGVAVWRSPGPSRRIPSAHLVSVAVDRDLPPTGSREALWTLAFGVGRQFEYATGGRGYIAADVPLVGEFGKLFTSAGWVAVGTAAAAPTVRHLYFARSLEVEPAHD